MSTPSRRLATLLIPVLMVLSLGACDRGASIDSLIAAAHQDQQTGDAKSAIIRLKNVLQREPHHAEARFLLGSLYLQVGEARAAENNLHEALLAKYHVEETLPLLARALFDQGQFQKLLDETRSSDWGDAALQAPVLSYRGHALLSLGNASEAERAFAAALKLQPDFAPARLGQARIAVQRHDPRAALALVDQAVGADPGSLDGWLMKGDLERALNGVEAAETAYRRALAVAPNSIPVNFNLASVALEQGHLDEAKKAVDALLKVAPRNPLGHYLQGLMAFRAGDYKAAREAVNQVLNVLPDYLPAKALSAAVSHRLGDDQLAEQQLQGILGQYPNSPYLSKLLAEIRLRQHKVQDALDLLEPLIKSQHGDAGVLALIASAYYQKGEAEQAKRYFEQAISRKPKDVQLRAGLGLARLAAGETERALKDLESAAAGGNDEADILLVTSLVSLKQYDKALVALDALAARRPKDAELLNKRGTLLLVLKRFPEARSNFEQALTLQPAYFPAAMNLAALDIREHKPEAARALYQKQLERAPSNIEVMTALAKLALLSGDRQQAVEWLERAKGIAPKDFSVNLILGSVLFEGQEYYKAISVLKDALATQPEHVEALNMIGYAQLRLGLASDAVATYTKLTSLHPNSPQALYGLGGAQAARGYDDSAIRTLQRALALRPDFTEAAVSLAALYIKSGKADAGRDLARQVQRQRPKSALGYTLEGDAQMAARQYGGAAASYQTAFDLDPSAGALVKLHQARSRNGEKEDDGLLADWLATHPDDVQVRLYYAGLALKKADYPLAVTQYRQVLAQQPDNLGVLHNLGWIYLQQGALSQAVEVAEQAYAANPDAPAVVADLSEALLRTGGAQRAVKLLEKARTAQPASQALRFRLAQAYLKISDKDHARAELKGLLSGEGDFPEREEAAALYERLLR